MTFAEKLKELRTQAGMSQSELAKASGRSLGAIRDYEQEKREPSLKAAILMTRALGVSVEAFAECVDGAESPASPGRQKATGPATAQKRPRGRKGT